MLQKSHYSYNAYSNHKPGNELSGEEKEQLILQYCDLVKYAALRLRSRLPSSVQFDDLFNAGVIGLMDALDKFDVSLGIQFQTYAKIRIKGAMLDEIRAMDWIPRSLRQKSNELQKTYAVLEQKLGRDPTDEEVAAELNLSLDDYYKLLEESRVVSLLPEDIGNLVQDDHVDHALATESAELFQKAYHQELKTHLTEAIASLPKKEQLVLALYYYEELTMKEIGQILDYTESRICQIHTKAVLKLRTKLARKLKREDLPDDLKVASSAV